MNLLPANIVPTPSEFESYKLIAEVASVNPYWKKVGGGGDLQATVATILSIMLLARELGISPIQAISGGIYNISGRFEISARMMNQLIRRCGHHIEIRHSDSQYCEIWSKRKDTGEEHTERYSFAEAKQAGLIKERSGWVTVPGDMLFARCISRLARRLYADCIGGCYVEGEMQETAGGKVLEKDQFNDLIELRSEMITEQKKEEEPIAFEFPEEDKGEMEEYLKECSTNSRKSIDFIKKRASNNMEGFLKAFETWKKVNGKDFPEFSGMEEYELIS